MDGPEKRTFRKPQVRKNNVKIDMLNYSCCKSIIMENMFFELYREMNTNLRFAVELSLQQIDSSQPENNFSQGRLQRRPGLQMSRPYPE